MQHRIGISSDNQPHIDRYALQVGAFVVNFGFLEFVSFIWVNALSKDPTLIEVAADMQLAPRIALLKKLVERELPDPAKKRALHLWDRVTELSNLRNAVCHNPYMFGWTSGIEEGEPDFTATPRMRDALRRKELKPMPNIEDVKKAVETTGEIGKELFEIVLAHLEEMAETKKDA
jgi:hypothetical protein